MRIAVASDHAGYELKGEIVELLRAGGGEALDLGTYGADPSDYPDHAEKVGLALKEGRAERGILICGSGVGVSVAANKMPGIRAGICHDTYSAHQGVEHDDMNVLCMGERVIGIEVAREVVASFLNAEYHPEERFERRLRKVRAVEARYMRSESAIHVEE